MTWLAIKAFFAGWRLYAALGVVAVLLFGVWKIYAAGKKAGEQGVREEAALEWSGRLEQVKQDSATEVAAAQARENRAEERATAFEASAREFAGIAARLSQQVSMIEQRRQVEHARLDSLSQEQLDAEIAAAIRSLGSRTVAQRIYDWPLLKDKHDALAAELAAVRGEVSDIRQQVAAQKEQVAALRDELRAKDRLIETYDVAYTYAFNAIGVKKRRAWPPWCWVKKCSVKLPIPSPEEIHP